MLSQLKNNQYICALGWNHLHVTIEGRVAPCCVYTAYTDVAATLYNLKTHTLAEAINSPGLNDMRRSMLEGKPHELCSVCNYNLSNGIRSPRDKYNEMYLEQTKHLIEKTNLDGSINVEDYKPIYVDLRVSNLCNIKCRMCSIQASSAWYNETVEFNKLTNAGPVYYDKKFENHDGISQVSYLLDNVEHMYWAGGEPLILDAHYKILQYLIDNNKAKNVSLVYSTNLTVSKYKGRSIIDYWKHFKHVFIVGSVDGLDNVYEYIRTGAEWETAKTVFNEFKNSGYKHIVINPCFTVSMLNILYITDLLKWCFENEWIPPDNPEVAINFVDYPPEMSIKYVPTDIKKLVNDKFNSLFNWLCERNNPRPIESISTILKYINGSETSQSLINDHLQKLHKRLDVYDITGNLNWKSSLPELSEILKNYQGS